MAKRKNADDKNKSKSWEFHEEWHGGNNCSCDCCGESGFGNGMRGWNGRGMHWHSGRGGGALGFIWPLLSSLVGVFFLFILASVFDYFGYKSTNMFFSDTASFLFHNLGLFFGLMLLFGYAKWLTRRFELLRAAKPIVKAANATVALWIIAMLFVETNVYAAHPIFTWMTFFIQDQLLAIFLVFLLIAYIGFFIKMMRMQRWKNEGNAVCTECGGMHFRDRRNAKHAAAAAAMAASHRAYKEEKWGNGRYKRLYRSDENKILGGVCGGIAEYFDVDPVIVRLLWVLAALAWGAGVLAYIIAWIIIPRRPK